MQLEQQGITRIAGRVLGDESWFDSVRTAPGWKPAYYLTESPPLSALVVDRAVYDGHLARQPALAAAGALPADAAQARDHVAAPSGSAARLPYAYGLAQVESEPCPTVLEEMGVDSDNFVAELMLKKIGAEAGGAARPPRAWRSSLRDLAARRRAARGRADGRRVGPVARRPAHGARADDAAGRRVERPRPAAPFCGGAPGRRCQRHARGPHASAPRARRRSCEDGDDEPCVGALRLCARPLRVRGDPERLARVGVVRAQGAGPLRHRACVNSAGRSSQLGLGRAAARRPSAPSRPSSRGSRRRTRRSSSSRRCRRPSRRAPPAPRVPPRGDIDSSVPVITYWLPVSGPRRVGRPRRPRTAVRSRAVPRRAPVVVVGEPLRDRFGAFRPEPWHLLISSGVDALQSVHGPEVAGQVLRAHPADPGDVQPEEHAAERDAFDASIASIAFVADVSLEAVELE